MTTVIFENVDKKKVNLLKQLAMELGIKAITKTNGVKSIKNEITIPKILKRIEKIKSGKAKYVEFKSMNDLKRSVLTNFSNA